MMNQGNRAFRIIANRAGKNDRLVKRFQTEGQLHVRLQLGGADPGHSRPVTAEVTNVSITGFLVRIDAKLVVRRGAKVTLGEGDSNALCRVAHANVVPSSGSQYLGLDIVEMSDPFRKELHLAVAALRKDRGEVLHAWEHST